VAYIEHLQSINDEQIIIVSCADKVQNISSMISDYELLGEVLWLRFNASKEDQLWYYETLNEIFQSKAIPDGLKNTSNSLIAELRQIIKN